MSEPLYLKDECYKLIGFCFEVHKNLGLGFKEIVYKDAIEQELQEHNIPYQRELSFEITYKGKILEHTYTADFVVDNSIILEIKSMSRLDGSSISQTLNYLKASGLRLGLLVNFGERSLSYKRLIK